jgi:aryl-alcohol dehydrogenase-like predicted oxidoreductase
VDPRYGFEMRDANVSVPERTLGRNGPTVSAIGLGCMGMSGAYGPADEKESLRTINAALDAGINLLDTGDFYGMGHNEMLLSQVLKDRRQDAFVCVKFGAMRSPQGAFVGVDARPAAVKNFLSYSLKRLGTDYVDLYQPARVDPNVPIEDTVGAMLELKEKGYLRHIGLSEAGTETIRRAAKVHPIAALQIEYAVVSRSIEERILPVTRELGISITAYGVLSRGLLSSGPIQTSSPGDYRAHLPRFQAENQAQNQKLIAALRSIADRKKCSLAHLAIAWAYHRGNDIIPLIGARKVDRLNEALGALHVELTPQDYEEIDREVPAGSIAGDRYPAEGMATLDSER